MSIRATRRRIAAPQTLVVLSAMLFALMLVPTPAAAQSCTTCIVYAITELNLRQDPALDAPVLRFIPRGAAVERTPGAEVNGYARVLFDSVPGWAVALGFVTSPEQIGAATVAAPAPVMPPAANPAASPDARVTLTPLFLRNGPDLEAAPILGMPEGALVTLTREGAENGYVTVDYDGVMGWAYADLLAREDEIV